jgi:hypothetical protein
MITHFPFEESEFELWKGCGVGSFVVIESQSEYVMPGFDELRNLPEPPSGPEFEASLREIGLDPATGTMRHSMTITTRLLAVAPNELTLQTEITRRMQNTSKMKDILHVHVVHDDPAPATETRTVVRDSPNAHAEVIKMPFSSLKQVTPPKETQEVLSIADQEIFCRVTEITVRVGDKEVWMKYWYSNNIPGGMAQLESRGGASNESCQRMSVLSFEKK